MERSRAEWFAVLTKAIRVIKAKGSLKDTVIYLYQYTNRKYILTNEEHSDLKIV